MNSSTDEATDGGACRDRPASNSHSTLGYWGGALALLTLVWLVVFAASPVAGVGAPADSLDGDAVRSSVTFATTSHPVARCSVSDTDVRTGESVTLDASASENADDYQYDKFGGSSFGEFTAQSSRTVSYAEPGTYDPRVKVWSYSSGGEDSDIATCGTVTVSDPTPTPTPTATATPAPTAVARCSVSDTDVQTGESVTLDASASENADDYQYDKFGGGSFGEFTAQSSRTVSYSEAGTYDPRVKVWSYSSGGEDSDIATCGTVTVSDPTPTPTPTPTATATPAPTAVARCSVSDTDIQTGESVTLDASASENADDYQYDKFGGGSFGEFTAQSSRTVSYAEPGTYDPRVKVWSYSGGEDSDTATCGTVTVSDPTPTPTPTTRAQFGVRIDGTNSPVTEGDALTVAAIIENTGSGSDTQSVTLSVDGAERDSERVTLSGGESTAVTLIWATSAGDAGEYTATVASADETASRAITVERAQQDESVDLAPPYFSVSIVGTNAPIAQAGVLNVTANVRNTGERRATQRVRLSVNGTTESGASRLVQPDATRLNLTGGESRTVTLSWNTSLGDAGQYVSTVASDNESASTPVNITSPLRASVTFDAQTVSDEVEPPVVTVSSVLVPDGGFVAIYNRSDSGNDTVIGVSRYFEPGTGADIQVAVDEDLATTQTFVAVPHRDTDGDNAFEFGTGDGVDVPYTIGERRVSDSASIIVPTDTPDPADRLTETPTDSPTPTPTAPPTPTATPTPNPNPDPTATATASDGPGFGAVQILLALVLLTLVAHRRGH